jgi:hypothetical protein
MSGTTCQLLNIFNGDRSNPMYLQTKSDLFKMGAECDCGAKIDETSCSKSTCETTIALENHLIYPTFSLLDKCKHNANHWAFIIEISQRKKILNQPEFLMGFTPLNEMVYLSFNNLGQDDVTKFSNIKAGQTLVVLYAEQDFKHEDNKLVMVKNSDFCFVFNASFVDVQIEAEKLLIASDLMSEKKELECFGCGIKTNIIMQCSACKLAKYCSKECQQKSWKMRHKNLCKQSETLLRLACLPRRQEIVPNKHYSFKIDEDTTSSPLPSYIYKSEFVQKPSLIKLV